MKWYLRSTSCACRETFCSSSRLMGSGRSEAGDHSAWLERGISLRRALPAARRSATVRTNSFPGKGVYDALIIAPLALPFAVYASTLDIALSKLARFGVPRPVVKSQQGVAGSYQ